MNILTILSLTTPKTPPNCDTPWAGQRESVTIVPARMRAQDAEDVGGFLANDFFVALVDRIASQYLPMSGSRGRSICSEVTVRPRP